MYIVIYDFILCDDGFLEMLCYGLFSGIHISVANLYFINIAPYIYLEEGNLSFDGNRSPLCLTVS